MKTSELIDQALDWAVSEAEGCSYADYFDDGVRNRRKWSTDWSQGGPIIEREGGALWSTNADGWRCKGRYDTINDKEGPIMGGPTPLIAAMRCYVASKLGDEVYIPEEINQRFTSQLSK